MLYLLKRCACALAFFSFCNGAFANTTKYVCLVTHLAGIQVEQDGHISSGNFHPQDDKFFLTIGTVMPLAECPTTKMQGLNYWYFCLARFAAQIDNRLVLRGDNATVFQGIAGGEYFQLASDMTFISITNNLAGGNYVSDGKCTAL